MYDILHRVGIAAKPEKVFKALTTIEGLRGWWFMPTTGDANEGGEIDLQFFQMKVMNVTAPAFVRWQCVRGPSEWVNTEISFRLEWREDQTFVLFKHANWREQCELMHHSTTKWGTFLLSLKNMLEKSEGRPIPNDVRIYIDG